MSEAVQSALPELPNIIELLAKKFEGTGFSQFLLTWENVIYSFIIIGFITLFVYLNVRKLAFIPGRRQGLLELVFGGIDDFVCGIMGEKGRAYTPFVGTLFIYILVMNLFGMLPFMKSPSSSWSTTLALALCVFIYVQFTALKELGIWGYVDHLMAQPRGALAWSVILPAFLFLLHIIAEVIRPVSLSLRLRTNVWGDDMLVAMMAQGGLKGLPMLFFISILALMTAVIQALVFSLLATVYLALVQKHEEVH